MASIRLGVLWPELGQGCASDEAIVGDRPERCFRGEISPEDKGSG